ncbi:hypothetical protein BGW39_003577 [Mortierella sp. 14UC]|nr:hypothetical protein BGW39_003577 [Mortierella sp. 14UC]
MPRLTEIRNLQDLAQDIAQLCPRLKSVQNEGVYEVSAQRLILQLLGTLPHQRVESFYCTGRHFDVVSDLSDVGGLFRRHSTTMRSIVLSGCQIINSKMIQAILVECQALERLFVGCLSDSTRHQLCVGLEDAIETPWACTRIQELKLTITIPDEPFHHLAEDAVPYYERPAPIALSTAEKEQLRSLEALYCQIGALTELHFVRLYAHFYDPQDLRPVSRDYQATTFPAMLNLGCEETGRPGFLHHLAGLTKLKQLFGSVSAETRETRSTIGKEEIVWMERHWPMLQGAGFLSRRAKNNIPEPFRWWKEQRAGKQFFIGA